METIPVYCGECGKKIGEIDAPEYEGHAAVINTCPECRMKNFTADEAVIEM